MTQQAPTAAQEMWTFLQARREQLAKSMDKTMDPDRMIRLAHAAATKTPKLLSCPMQSIYIALTRAGQMGLEPNTPFDHGYLIPRYNKETRGQECHFEPSYKGLIRVAKKSGAVQAIWAEVVYEKDHFKPVRGHNPSIEHEPYYGSEPRGKMIAAYAVAVLPDGSRQDVLLHHEDIERLKAFVASQNKDGTLKGPWNSHEDEMAKKSAIRKLFKTLGVGPLEEASVEVDEDAAPQAEISAPAPRQITGKGQAAVLSKLSQPRELPAPSLPPEVTQTSRPAVTQASSDDAEVEVEAEGQAL